jgi:peroxisomal membrane protein 4
LKATRQHARNLSVFAIIYKASMILLRNIPGGAGKEGRYDTFFAGLLGGYAVFGRQPGSISQQVCDLKNSLIVETIQPWTPEYTPDFLQS